MSADPAVEDLLRELAPQVLGALVRRNGDFAACEDAVQEALLAAAGQWPAEGVPANPRGWLATVARRRLTDEIRAAGARRRREDDDLVRRPTGWDVDWSMADDAGADRDDELLLLLLCCHPVLTPPSQVALTLRAVGGLTTAEIASAFLVPESTMAQRISRAKQRIAEAGAGFVRPAPEELDARLDAVRRVLYLTFNEGYSATSGDELQRRDLAADGIRLARRLLAARPDDPESAGLLALMLLTEARHAARVGPAGELVPLAEQDRSRWDRALIDEGVALLLATLPTGPVGPYQLQAAIAGVHDEAASVDDTDWAEILGLYDLLLRIDPNPVAALNRAVALGWVRGPEAGLVELDALAADGPLAGHHRLHVVRAHLLERAGDVGAARAELEEAARRTTSVPERRFLERRVRELR